VKPTPKAGNKPSPHFIVHGLAKPGSFTTVSNNALFRDLLTLLDRTSPERWVRCIDVVVDNDRIQKAKAVEQWFAAHPRFGLLW
jgi:hypothetical protein